MEDGAVPLGCGVVLEDGLEEDLLDALFMLSMSRGPEERRTRWPLIVELQCGSRRPGGPPVNVAQEGCVPVPLRQGAAWGNSLVLNLRRVR